MKIDVKRLLTQPENTTESHEINLNNLELGDNNTANVTGSATLASLADFILARISGNVTITMPCHRCLKTTQLDMGLDFSSQFYQQINPDIDGYPITDGNIDLIKPLTDEIISNLPIKVLCCNNCKGLCPVCGNNLNDNPCKCAKVEFEVSNKIRFEDGSSTKKEN